MITLKTTDPIHLGAGETVVIRATVHVGRPSQRGGMSYWFGVSAQQVDSDDRGENLHGERGELKALGKATVELAAHFTAPTTGARYAFCVDAQLGANSGSCSAGVRQLEVTRTDGSVVFTLPPRVS